MTISLPADSSASPPAAAGHLAYVAFMHEAEPRLRRALVARYGPEVGREATADALAWGWEHWSRLEPMKNPVGYLFRVGQSAARRHRRSEPPIVDRPSADDPQVEPALAAGLEELSDRQRTLVLLVHGYGYSIAEAAATLGISKSSAQRHLERGLSRLRSHLEVTDD